VKINRNPISTELQELEELGTCQIPKVFYPQLQAKVEGPTCKANRFGLRHSVWKVARVGRILKGLQIYDAMNVLNNLDNKASTIFRKLLNNGRLSGIQLGMEESRMYIKTIVCGKGFLGKKIDIKGRGRMGIIKIPKTSIKMVIEEIPIEEWYKLMITGKCPMMTAEILKSMAMQSEGDFEKVKQISHMTTSAGRHYRKT